jgi:hypothetical protein
MRRVLQRNLRRPLKRSVWTKVDDIPYEWMRRGDIDNPPLADERRRVFGQLASSEQRLQ